MPEMVLRVQYERKDEAPDALIRTEHELVGRIRDVLGDNTKHDEINAFRVTQVTRA